MIRELVLSGGPCAGKSSCLPALTEFLRDRGWQTIIAPEIASMVMDGGFSLSGHKGVHYSAVAVALIEFQSNRRESYRALAHASGQDTIILYDRGECDAAAYIGEELFSKIAARSLSQYAQSYDGILLLHSLAFDQPEQYAALMHSNPHRSENAEKAALLDKQTFQAWLGGHCASVANSSDWEAKQRQVCSEAARLLGIPERLEIERKWVLEAAPKLPDTARLSVEIEQKYLEGEWEERIRKRSDKWGTVYVRTQKTEVSPGVREEEEWMATEAEWNRAQMLPGTQAILKTRTILADEGRIWEVDEFHSPPGLWIVEVELASLEEELTLPSWLKGREVTKDKTFSNRQLAELG
jgi:CYTH domain-containing protein/predicted ATPase